MLVSAGHIIVKQNIARFRITLVRSNQGRVGDPSCFLGLAAAQQRPNLIRRLAVTFLLRHELIERPSNLILIGGNRHFIFFQNVVNLLTVPMLLRLVRLALLRCFRGNRLKQQGISFCLIGIQF